MVYRQEHGPGQRVLEVSRRTLLLGAATAAAALSACGGSGSEPRRPRAANPEVLRAADVRRAQPPGDAPVAECLTGMTAFTQRLAAASAEAGKNWIVSPLSIACAFAMARVGAAGGTAAQLDEVFGFPRRGRDDAFNAITGRLATTDGPPGKLPAWKPGSSTPMPAPVVSLGNALFTAERFQVGQEFLRTLAASYGTGARPVDFTSEQATKQINAWVSAQTAGRITRLFDRLAPDTKVVLANAVYFKGYWAAQFLPEQTTPGPFTRAGAGPVTAMLMSRVGSFRYAEVNGVQAVELRYGGGDYAMRLVLPAPGTSPGETLSPAVVAAVDAALAERLVTVTVPRFDFATDLDLGQALRGLGLTAPFGPGADFSGIARDAHIGQAVHRANVTVDEAGTEAAAATGLALPTSAQAPPPLTFRADRPFAFTVLAGTDRIPLFAGQVHDPTAR